MNTTPILLLSLFGFVASWVFPIYFLRSLNDPTMDSSLRLASMFISIGSVIGIGYFAFNAFSTCCLNKVTKCISHLCSVLLLCISLLFVILATTLYRENTFTEDDIDSLHIIEQSVNCCGWKTLIIEGCYAQTITEQTQTCYDAIGKNIDYSMLTLLTFYIIFTFIILLTFFLMIKTKSVIQEENNKDEKKKEE